VKNNGPETKENAITGKNGNQEIRKSGMVLEGF
jgi:hypothetical protein